MLSMFDDCGLPIQKRFAVAYIDTLGIKQKITKESDWGFISLWALTGPILGKWKSHERLKIKIFSDNILICEEVSDAAPKTAAQDVLSVVDTIEESMFNTGSLFVRGAVVVDDLHFSETFVYGKALLKAHNIENQTAVFPRIVIDSSAFDFIGKEDSYISVDGDGNYFYDFMQARIDKRDSGLSQSLGVFKGNILINIKNHAADMSVLEKMEWLINYYNATCIKNDLPQRISREDIERQGVKTSPIRIIANNPQRAKN